MPAEPRLARRPRVRYVFLAYVSRRKQTQRGRDFPKPNADEALKLLLAGNCRFAEGNPMFVTK
ncbi:MAG: hypothetical protein NTX51_11925 [Verrucomicrobia bacterium]|nr:hypothetical protein [Verrucomicrobiota bacterium]